MDVEPEIVLEDGEITDSSDEDAGCTPNKPPPVYLNKKLKCTPKSTFDDVEIHDEEVDYTPLKRPQNFTNTYKPPQKTSDNDTDSSSSSDSDSDDCAAKKPKVKIKSKKIAKPALKRKKYDIWNSHVQEDVLAETLISCDVSNIDRSRDVETYPLPYNNTFDLRDVISKKQGYKSNKRRYDERNNKKFSSRRRNGNAKGAKGSKREILKLSTNVDDTDEDVAKDIANKLCEEKDELIKRVVQVIGKKKSIEIFNETSRIELDGGMLIMILQTKMSIHVTNIQEPIKYEELVIVRLYKGEYAHPPFSCDYMESCHMNTCYKNGTRRRTPGGVFIFLLKRDSDISSDQQKQIFADDRKEQNRERKAQQQAKLKAIKKQIAAKKSASSKLPSLLSRSDLEARNAPTLRDRNESEPEDFVNNPPPSPATDGKENSNDELGIPSYFLESGSVVDMETF